MGVIDVSRLIVTTGQSNFVAHTSWVNRMTLTGRRTNVSSRLRGTTSRAGWESRERFSWRDSYFFLPAFSAAVREGSDDEMVSRMQQGHKR